jgi:hypothetical protein
MTREIFISYRRGDSPGYTGRIFDRLEDRFGAGVVFMDVDGIDPGLDFVDVLNDQLDACKAMIAVIGPQWTSAADGQGRPRLHDPNDFVRLEIIHALSRNIRVIPVLVEGADPPRTEDLPPELQALARRQSVTLTHERFGQDIAMLVRALENAIGVGDGKPKASPIAAPQIDLETAVLTALRSMSGYAELSVSPSIAHQKEANARRRAQVPSSTKVLGLIDMTVFGNANDALVFGDDKIYQHHMGTLQQIEYVQLKSGAIEASGVIDVTAAGRVIPASGCGSRANLIATLAAVRDAT